MHHHYNLRVSCLWVVASQSDTHVLALGGWEVVVAVVVPLGKIWHRYVCEGTYVVKTEVSAIQVGTVGHKT